jgi:hypothetical protein
MIVNIWLMYKAGEPRTYTRCTSPSELEKKRFINQGFQIFRAEVDLPVDKNTEAVKQQSLFDETDL